MTPPPHHHSPLNKLSLCIIAIFALISLSIQQTTATTPTSSHNIPIVAAAASSSLDADAQKPGLRFLLENSGLNQIVSDALPQIIANIEATQFPDQNLTEHVSLVGNVDITLTGIHIAELQIEALQATFKKPNVISVTATGVTVKIALAFSFRQESWPHTSGSGTIEATSAGATMAISISTTSTPQQKPHFHADQVDVDLGKMDVKIHGGGGVGWLLNVLEGVFADKIKSSIEDTIEQNLEDTINVQVNQLIADTPFVVSVPLKQLETSLDIDLSMTSAPSVIETTAAALVLDTKAETYITGHHEEPPFSPVDVPSDVSVSTNDFSLYVTQWIANDAAWQLYHANKLHYRLTNDLVPKESPIHLNTTDLKNYIPELYAKFPNQLVVIDVAAASSPEVSFSASGGVSAVINSTLAFSVVAKDGSLTPAFTMDALMGVSVSAFSVDASTTGTSLNITGKLDPFKMDLKLEKSSIGDVNVDHIHQTLNVLINFGIVPYINQQLQQGQIIELPEGLKVSNIVFEFKTGFLSLGGKVAYAPKVGSALYRWKRRALLSKPERDILKREKCDEDRNYIRKLECQPLWELYVN